MALPARYRLPTTLTSVQFVVSITSTMNIRNRTLARAIMVVGGSVAAFMVARWLARSGAFVPFILILAVIGTLVWSVRNTRSSKGFRKGLSWFLLIAFMLLLGTFIKATQQQRSWQHRDDRMRTALASNPLEGQETSEFSSNLPVIILETDGRSISKEPPTLARASVFEPQNGRASIRNKPDHTGLVSVNLRGYSTIRLPKHSLTLHTLDAQTNQVKIPLLGLPPEEDWVLYAPFEDKSLIRDVLAFQLARSMGRYAPRTRYVELFIKSNKGPLRSRDYVGVYVLTEKIKRGKDRVPIQKLNPSHRAEPEISGGYIIRRDHNDRNEARFHTKRGGPYFFVYPKAEAITPEQRAWLTGYLNAFESALQGPDFQDPQKGYAAFLDVDSFIDAHWLIELGKNVDGFRYSAYLSKDRDGKIRPEPPWDWNRSFGNANYYDGWREQGWYWPRLRPREISWYRRLREDPAFAKKAADRWTELRASAFSREKIQSLIDQSAAELQEAQARNFKRWPILGMPVTCNYYVGDSFHDEVEWLKSWVDGRLKWIDAQVAAERSSKAPSRVEDPEE